jgi:YD repeat-containing protein
MVLSLSRRSIMRLGAAALALLSVTAVSFPQVIENPKSPPAPNAGRVVPLKEVARITDEKGKFFFVQPIAVFTGHDGSVYVQEYKQLLKFDAQGRFVKNLLKRGQGPGEFDDNLTDLWYPSGNHVQYAYDGSNRLARVYDPARGLEFAGAMVLMVGQSRARVTK